jgi:hypothetical protein
MKIAEKKFVYLTAIIILLYLGMPGLVGGAASASKKPPSDIPVTARLQITGDPLLSTNYTIEGDGFGSYQNGLDSVSSILQAGGWDWELNGLSSLTRTALIDLRRPVPNSGAQQVFAYEYLPFRIIVKAAAAQVGSFRYMMLNQTLSAPVFVRFTYGPTDYRLAMSSGPNVTPDYPETNNVRVTCTAVNSSATECVAWKVEPITQAGGAVESIARLQRFGKGGSLTDLGDFYVSFLFNVTNP